MEEQIMASWLRLWHDMPTDPKWRVIAKRSGQSIGNVIAVFNMMLVCASVADERGTLHNWNDEDAAAALDLEESDIAAIRKAMQGKVIDGDQLTGWQKRQPEREDYSTPRVRRYREEHKQDETQCNADETHGNNTEKNRPEQIQNRTDTEQIQKKEAEEFSSKPHKANAVAHLKQLLQKHDPELIKEFDRAPRAPDIEQLISVAEKYGPQMVGDIKGWEAAEKALNWMEQDEFWKQHASVYWLFDVKGGGKKATANLREFSRKKSNGKTIGLAATFGDGNPFPVGETF